MKPILILLTMFFTVSFSCNSTNTEKANMVQVRYNTPLLKQLIEGFIKSLADNAPKYITIDLTTKSDTTSLSLVNIFPDFQYAHFKGYDTLNGFKLIFIGDVNDNFYKVTAKYEVPKEILELSERTYHGDYPPPSINPKQWTFNFRDNRLIELTPKDEIEKYIQPSSIKL